MGLRTPGKSLGDSRRERAFGALLIASLLVVVALSSMSTTGLPPPPASPSPGVAPLAGGSFSFGAAGDFGFPGNTDMIALSKRLAIANANFLLALGDLGYTTDEAGWCSSIKSGIKDVLLIAGNHDSGESAGGDIAEFVKYCPFTLGVPVTAGPGTPGYGYEYYFDYPATQPLARFLLIAAGTHGSLDYDYSPGSIHWNFVVDAVNGARTSGIPWVVVGQHKTCINVGTYGCEMTQALFDKLVGLKVDLILQAHYHSYQRSKQIALGTSCPTVPANGGFDADCVVDGGTDGTYAPRAGTVVVTNGAGGRSLYNVPLDGSDAELGYFAQVMGANGNTQGLAAGHGAVVFTVSSTGIEARTDFCPLGTTDAGGQCPGVAASTFQDRFALTSTAPSDFAVLVQPTSLQMPRSATSTATVSVLGTSTTPVTLSVSGCPANTSCSISPVSGFPIFASVLRVETGPSSPEGSFDLVVSGTNGTVSRTAILDLAITGSITRTFQKGDGGPFSETDDTYLYDATPDATFGTDAMLFVDGSGCIASASVCKTLIKFPSFMGADPAQVPSGATIVSATLDLTVRNPGGTQDAYQITSAWSEATATWNAFPTPGVPANRGLEFAFSPTVLGRFPLDITSIVQRWANGEANEGILLASTHWDGVDYDSSESANPPKLTVQFVLPPGSVSPGLVLHYDMETLLPDGRMEDLSGHGNHGAISGPANVVGKVGRARDFDSRGADRIVVSPGPTASSAFTYAFWIFPKPSGVGGVAARIASRSSDRFEIGISAGTGEITFYDGAWKSSATAVPFNVWTHITMTWDGATVMTYKDGVLSGVVAGGRTLTGNQYFGSRWFSGSEGYETYHGTIDEIRLFDRQLSDSEIANLVPDVQSPRLAYDMDHLTTDVKMEDRSGHGYHGTIVGTANVVGKVGRARDFDSRGADRIVVSPGPTASSAFTYAFWIFPKPSGVGGVAARIASRSSDRFEIGISAGTGEITFYDGAWKSTGVTVPFDTWTHIALAWEGTNIRTYRDGTISSTVSGGRTLTGNQYFGSRWFSGSEGYETYHGTIDEIRLFDRQLSDSEIANLVSGGSLLSRSTQKMSVSVGPEIHSSFQTCACSNPGQRPISRPTDHDE